MNILSICHLDLICLSFSMDEPKVKLSNTSFRMSNSNIIKTHQINTEINVNEALTVECGEESFVFRQSKWQPSEIKRMRFEHFYTGLCLCAKRWIKKRANGKRWYVIEKNGSIRSRDQTQRQREKRGRFRIFSRERDITFFIVLLVVY